MINFRRSVDKLYDIFEKNTDLSKKFYLKWGVDLIDFRRKITDPLTHGGYISKATSLNNIKLSNIKNVLDIGPEMGLEVFMLSEIASSILVCDPDQSNLDLIQQIASHYVNDNGVVVSSFIEYRALGFNNNVLFSSTEKNMYRNIVKKLGHSLPAFYQVTSVDSLSNLSNKFDLVFIHKILTTITRSGGKDSLEVFKSAIEDVVELIGPQGICSWTEPRFVWEQKGVLDKIPTLLNVDIEMIEYKPGDLPEKFVQMLIKKRTI